MDLAMNLTINSAKEMTNNAEAILKIHELKTARLFQVALAGSFLLMSKIPQNIWSTDWRPYWKLGRALGIVFQLLDDITELFNTGDSQSHEEEINPWPYHYHLLCNTIQQEIAVILKISQTFNLQNLNLVWRPYFSSFVNAIEINQDKLFCALTKKQNTNLKKIDLQLLVGALQGLNLK